MIIAGIFSALTDDKGFGVFTKKKIAKGTLIEISPVVVMSAKEKKMVEQTKLYNYIFDWEKKQCCMALGFVPIYNHAYEANCEYMQDYENHTIMIVAVRDIEKNEELTINYNGSWNNPKKVWFEVAPITTPTSR